MSRYSFKRPDTDPEREWGDAGLPVGSPNDPAIGEALNQTAGPGGFGLRARPRRLPVDDSEA
jgi:hypothetical protein